MFQRAWEALRVGDLQSAARICRRMNRQFSRFAPGWYTSSIVAQQTRDRGKAFQLIERALQLEPDVAPFHVHKANCLADLERYSEAANLADALAGQECDDAGLLAAIDRKSVV